MLENGCNIFFLFSVKLLGMEEEKAKDDKLLWKLMKRKRKHEAPASPMGPDGLLRFDTSNGHYKSAGVRLSFNHKQITKGCTRALGPQTPCLNTWIPLGSSPSQAIKPPTSCKRIIP